MTTPATAPAPRWLGDAGQVALAVVLAGVLLPPGLQSVHVGGVPAAWAVAIAGAIIVVHLCVTTARRRPIHSFAVGSFACAILLVAPEVDGVTDFLESSRYSPILLPSALCFFPLLYAVSAHTRPPWPNAALGVGLVGSGLTLARLWGFTGTPIRPWAWWLLVGTAAVGGTVAAWSMGRYRATRAAWTAQLAERAAADERRRIAREMHDVVAHSLAVMVSQAEAGRLVVPGSPERAPEILTTIADAGREALTEMRGLLGVLRDDEVPTEPQPGLADLPALIERVRAAGVEVEFSADEPLQVPPAVGLTVYRVVQESLTNVTRHAGRRATARVTVGRAADGIGVLVTNTGTVPTAARPGRGLTGMRERVEAVGGTLEAGPAGEGWRVSVKVPL
ncbi:sensor histidine kinase [Kribbella sp. CA-293567]|uniref:sensor histidine kinase n=1 Tax=Kribbella sp. CA-293567 TaxID=3002436 RepID=UPI0022DE362D|nr:sensor histidine kinase [Kribbella sp. CA-293567]WBQ06214.1 sensor histidine kinase [Kribbella sp. CA-293567]